MAAVVLVRTVTDQSITRRIGPAASALQPDLQENKVWIGNSSGIATPTDTGAKGRDLLALANDAALQSEIVARIEGATIAPAVVAATGKISTTSTAADSIETAGGVRSTGGAVPGTPGATDCLFGGGVGRFGTRVQAGSDTGIGGEAYQFRADLTTAGSTPSYLGAMRMFLLGSGNTGANAANYTRTTIFGQGTFTAALGSFSVVDTNNDTNSVTTAAAYRAGVTKGAASTITNAIAYEVGPLGGTNKYSLFSTASDVDLLNGGRGVFGALSWVDSEKLRVAGTIRGAIAKPTFTDLASVTAFLDSIFS